MFFIIYAKGLLRTNIAKYSFYDRMWVLTGLFARFWVGVANAKAFFQTAHCHFANCTQATGL